MTNESLYTPDCYPGLMTDTPYTRGQLEAMDIDALDRMAFGHAGGDVVELSPSQIQIQYTDDLENAHYQHAQTGPGWAKSVDLSEPVDVSIGDDGVMRLEDGHHRWLAASLSKRSLRARIEIKGRPIEVLLARQEEPQLKAKRPGC